MSELVIHDETLSGEPLRQVRLPDLPRTVTLREIVRHRVREEVARHNVDPGANFTGLVQPRDAEVAVNGRRALSRRIDWEEQARVALDAFGRNGFFVLVDDRQVEDLDAVIDLDTDPHVAFVRLTPLVGG